MGAWTCRVRLGQVGWNLLTVVSVLTGLSCGGDVTAPTTGSVEINTGTSGPEPDADGYAVIIDGGPEAALGANATLQRYLGPGDHNVRLTGVAPNCAVAGENPRTVRVRAGETSEVSFQLTCSATAGSLKITTATSGSSPDPDGYIITLDGKNRLRLGVSADATFARLTLGGHVVGVGDIAANCRAQGVNPRSVTITAGTTATVTISITCSAPIGTNLATVR
jgi:hypothetical protein